MIFLVFTSIVIVLWVGAQDVLAGDITPGALANLCSTPYLPRVDSAN